MKKRTLKRWITAIMTGCMAVGFGITAQAATYGDVNPGDWYYEDVQYVSDHGIMKGYVNGKFGPTDQLTRGQFAIILYRNSGSPEVSYSAVYPDVADGAYYTDAIMWAKDTGVITGYTDSGKFGPNDSINREQMATILYRYEGSPEVDKGAWIKAL